MHTTTGTCLNEVRGGSHITTFTEKGTVVEKCNHTNDNTRCVWQNETRFSHRICPFAIVYCIVLQSTRTNNCAQQPPKPGATIARSCVYFKRGGGGETHVKIKEGAVTPVRNRLCAVGPLHQYLVHLSRGRERGRAYRTIMAVVYARISLSYTPAHPPPHSLPPCNYADRNFYVVSLHYKYRHVRLRRLYACCTVNHSARVCDSRSIYSALFSSSLREWRWSGW